MSDDLDKPYIPEYSLKEAGMTMDDYYASPYASPYYEMYKKRTLVTGLKEKKEKDELAAAKETAKIAAKEAENKEESNTIHVVDTLKN